MSTSTLIQLENVSAAIGTTQVLHHINWQITAGRHWIITGPMGAGKSALTRCLKGELRVLEGKLRYPFLGGDAGFEARRKAIHLASFSDTSKLFRGPNAVHYYQQRYNAFDSEGHLTVRQYLEYAGFSEDKGEHREVMQQMRLEGMLDRERIKLSSGQTRKMLLARAMLGQPQVLILDNPYIGLDHRARQVFNQLIDRLAFEKNITIILAGHYQQLPGCITHRIHLEKGRVAAAGAVSEVEEKWRPQEPSFDEDLLAEIRSYYRQHRPESDFESIVRLNQVNVHYGNQHILKDLDWQVRPGEKWSLFGPNGSGKSTLLALLFGDHPQAYANEIYLFDRRRGSGESIWDIKKRIGFTSSELHAYFDHNPIALQVVLSGLWDRRVRPRPTSEQAAFAELLCRFFELEHHMQAPFRQLSTGTQRLLFFLRALIRCPELLLLDEPFQGFDDTTIQKSRFLLNEILTEDHTLIFITHYQRESPKNVDRVFRL